MPILDYIANGGKIFEYAIYKKRPMVRGNIK